VADLDLRSAVEAGNARYAKAIETGDGEALAAVFADDGGIIDPDFGNTIGASALRQLAGILTRDGAQVSFVIETHRAKPESETVGWASGSWRLSVTQVAGPEVGQQAESAGTFVELWRRDPDGPWRLYRDVTLRAGRRQAPSAGGER
jgi:ketosteroid isomerase-like protein